MGSEIMAALSLPPAGFPVWPANLPIVNAFTAVGTQWNAVSTGTGGLFWMGLDYMRVQAGFAFANITLTPRQWNELRVMEREASSAMNGVQG